LSTDAAKGALAGVGGRRTWTEGAGSGRKTTKGERTMTHFSAKSLPTLICIKAESEEGCVDGRCHGHGYGELQWSAEQSRCANWHHNGPLIMAITQQSVGEFAPAQRKIYPELAIGSMFTHKIVS